MFGMFCCVLCFLFSGSVEGGPLTSPHANMTDQELFWGSDQYDFAVVLPAAGTECFWHFAHRGENFYLNFMVQWVTGVGHDRHLSVTVNAPGGLMLETVDDAQGQITFDASETGFYQMCFVNFHNRFSTMQVFISFGVYYGTDHQTSETAKTLEDEEKKKKQEEISKKMNNSLNIIEDATRKVENSVFHMFRYYSFGRMRKSSDYYLLLSNSQYISWWSVALSLLIVTSGYLQLVFLKNMFVSKNNSEEEKPRC